MLVISLWRKPRRSENRTTISSDLGWRKVMVDIWTLTEGRARPYIYIHTDFPQLLGETVEMVRWFYLVSGQCIWRMFMLGYSTFCYIEEHIFIRNEVRGGGGGEYWIHPVCPSVRPSVCLSVNLSCPPRSIYSSGWIISMFRMDYFYIWYKWSLAW